MQRSVVRRINSKPASVASSKWRMMKTRFSPVPFLYFSLAAVFLFANAYKSLYFNSLITDSVFRFEWANLLEPLLFSAVFFLLMLRSKRSFFFILTYIIQVLYLFSNLSYHYYSQNYLHASQYFGLFTESLTLVGHSAIPPDARYWYILMDVPACAGIIALYAGVADIARRTIGKKLYISTYATALVLLFFADVGALYVPREMMDDEYMSQSEVVKKYGLFVFNAIDFIYYPQNKNMISTFSRGDTLSVKEKGPSKLNVVMIQVESLDAFAINEKYRNSYVMPFLRSLAQKSLYYPYMLSYHLAGGTSDCEFSVINSVEPLDRFPSMKIRNYDYPNSLARKFNEAGYSTAAFHGNRGDYFNRKPALIRMQFQKFNDIFDLGLKEEGWGASDSAVFDRVLDSMQVQPEPFFYYLITMSSHEPFELVKQYYADKRFNSIPGRLSRDYLVSMAYVDRTIKQFVKEVWTIRPNTCIFIYGDHTPGIRAGYYGQSALTFQNQYLEFVPLIICVPKAPPYREDTKAVSFVDVGPTVAEAAGIPANLITAGTNLLEYPIDSGMIDFRGKSLKRTALFSLMEHLKDSISTARK
jgi:lipoteichoic acid synthase